MDCGLYYRRCMEGEGGVKSLCRRAKKITLIIGTLLIIGLFIGFIIILICRRWYYDVEFITDVSPIEIINIFLTAFIAVWLGRYVTRRMAEQRFVKESIIADVYKIEESLNVIEGLTVADKLDVGMIFQRLQILRMKIRTLKKTSELAEISSPEIAKLDTLHTRIYIVATSADGEEVDIASRKDEIQMLLSRFTVVLRTIVYHINKRS